MLQKALLSNLKKHLNPQSQVVMRADFNVPIKEGTVKDTNRIQATIPTIKSVLESNPKSLVLLSHLGRPNGQKSQKNSLRPIVPHLQQYLNRKVTFLQDCVGQSVINRVKSAQNQVFLCQNVRFHPEQEGSVKDSNGVKKKCDPQEIKKFRNQLTQLGNVYVNDAFGTAHRAHSSVVGIAHKYRVAGLLLQKQIKYLGGFIQDPKKPVLVILGGAKVIDKIPLIEQMIQISDEIIISGGMGIPFLKNVFGKKVGSTKIVAPEDQNVLSNILSVAAKKNVKIHFDIDAVATQQQDPNKATTSKIFDYQHGIEDGYYKFDCGPASVKNYDRIIMNAKSIFWNGPVGFIQNDVFRSGSRGVLDSVIKATSKGCQTIIGGGDTAGLINNEGKSKEVSYISTGGGASLQLMQGKKLPGIQALSLISDLQ